jgi:hypothetical protein
MMMVLVMVHFANSKPLAPPTILIMNPLMFPPPGEEVSVALQQQEDENAFFSRNATRLVGFTHD